MAEISPFRRRMIEDMTVRNLSPATQQSFLSAVLKFSRYFGRSPDRLGLEDVHAFQFHLVARVVSWPALSALRFFYGVTLSQATVPERIAYAAGRVERQRGRGPPGIPSLKSRAALTKIYGAGLRVSRVASRHP
jgi:integrase/recombinase XerD